MLDDFRAQDYLYFPLRKYNDVIILIETVQKNPDTGLFAQNAYFGKLRKVETKKFELKNIASGLRLVQNEANIYRNVILCLTFLIKLNIIFDFLGERIILESSGNFIQQFLNISLYRIY